MVPQFTVYNIFFNQYGKEVNKSAFLNNHKYLKLREGYYSLFACKALDEIEKRLHYMLFTDENRGDVAFIAEKEGTNGQMELIQFDIKEYHEIDKKNFMV